MKKNKGSLSVEATISFTVFISFMFLLLSVIKFTMTEIVLSAAVNETAKQFATAAYPVGLLNGIQSDLDEHSDAYQGSVKLAEGIGNTAIDTGINFLFATSNSGGGAALQSGVMGLLGNFIDKAEAELWDMVKDQLVQLKSEAGARMVAGVFNEFVEDSYVNLNPENLELTIVKFPQTDYEYTQTKANANYAKFNMTADTDFGIDDVVICVEYKYSFALPFLPSVDTVIRKAAVERAWITGSSGTVTARGDKGLLEKASAAVFGKVTVAVGMGRTGKCYHRLDCFTLWRGAEAVPLSRVINTLEPCKVCRPDTMLGE